MQIEDRNFELERELDRFIDQEEDIRTKLKDRNRSPLRIDELNLAQ